jgi:hypothetical protein
MDNDRDYRQMFFRCRQDSFVSRIAHAKGIELANLILNPGSIGNIEDCAKEFRRAIKSAEVSLQQVIDGDEGLAIYLDLGPL